MEENNNINMQENNNVNMQENNNVNMQENNNNNNVKKGSNIKYILLVIALLIIIGLLSVLVYKVYTDKNNGDGSNGSQVTNELTVEDKKAILNILDLTEDGYKKVSKEEVKSLDFDTSKEYIDLSGPKVINALLLLDETGDIDVNKLDASALRNIIMYYAINHELTEKMIVGSDVVAGNGITKDTYKKIASIFGITLEAEKVFTADFRKNNYLVDNNEGWFSHFVMANDSINFTKKDNLITLKYTLHYERIDENDVTTLTDNKVNEKVFTITFVKNKDTYTMQSLNIIDNSIKDEKTTDNNLTTNNTSNTPVTVSKPITEEEGKAVVDILGLTSGGYKSISAQEMKDNNLSSTTKRFVDMDGMKVIDIFLKIDENGQVYINDLDYYDLVSIISNYAYSHNMIVDDYLDANGNPIRAITKANAIKIAKIFGINTNKLVFNNGYLEDINTGFVSNYVGIMDGVGLAKDNNQIILTYNIQYEKEVKKTADMTTSRLIDNTYKFIFMHENDSYTLKSVSVTVK